MLGLLQWLSRALSSLRASAGPRPTSPSSSSKSNASSTNVPTTTKPAPVVIKDAGLSFKSPLKKINPADVRFVVIHHTANANPAWGVRECHAFHRDGRGWSGIGYNYFIEQDGRVFEGRSDLDTDYIGAHVEGYNSRSIGLCLAGNYDVQTPTPANLLITAQVATMVLKRYGLTPSALRYHSELADKSCPGKNFPARTEFAKLVASVF